ncbi:N-acetylglutamate synthase, GNAT family [Parasphingorhabdus marina DSM 22363]|uniref:N-acetylglutamate synthase, GNAT family n=1 Tax=Parasphingorhabdus marina DSM 22363 TaxID=1123272 RepID=A0A1N6CN13_9SPHN|nr:GNAT family N-acetyltransferase [Parasphingorhabdus marina]SIN59971.1 N-acetylglutamate synthase, GNAT family [Parasphingorhabdus marina DSM 22363]
MAEEWIIRRASEEDAPLLPDIEISAGAAFRTQQDLEWVADDEVWSAEEHLDWMEKGLVWVAAESRNRPVAFLITEVFGDTLHVWEVSVHHAEQGHGLGRRLMEVAEAHAREAGLRDLTLTTFRDVVFNEQFYHRLGYQTLHADEISPRLQQVLEREAAEGLPIDRRCAMRKRL